MSNTGLVGTGNPTESEVQYGTQPLSSQSLTLTSEMSVSQLSVQDSDAKILRLKNVGFRIIGKLQTEANTFCSWFLSIGVRETLCRK